MKSIRHFLGNHVRQLLVGLAIAGAVAWLLLYRLGSLTDGMDGSEQLLPTVKASLHLLIHNPLALPLIIARLFVALISPTGGQTVSRLPSVLLGVVVLGLFYWLIRRWYGVRVALYGTIMFVVSPWFLRTTRLATSDIVYPLGILLFMALFVLLPKYGNRQRVFYSSAVLLGILLYIPGLVWFLPIFIVGQRRVFSELWKSYAGPPKQLLWSVLALGSIAPLIVSLVRQPHLIYNWVGLPEKLLGPVAILRHLRDTLSSVFIHSNLSPTLTLGHLPLLDVLSGIMFIAGLFFYARHLRAPRTQLLACIFVISLVLIALGGPVSISILLPVIFIIASAGVAYILHQWLSVVPRNPVARSFGFGLLALVLILGVSYDLRQYFVAWPDNTTTRASFQVHD